MRVQFKKTTQPHNSFTMQMYHRWTIVPMLRKLTCSMELIHTIMIMYQLNCKLITVNSYSED